MFAFSSSELVQTVSCKERLLGQFAVVFSVWAPPIEVHATANVAQYNINHNKTRHSQRELSPQELPTKYGAWVLWMCMESFPQP